MKLAEALIFRVDVQKRLRELEKRMERVALRQEGDEAAEDPQELLKETEELYGTLEKLICNINHTNCRVKDGEKSLADLLCQRDMLQKKQVLLRNLAEWGTVTRRRCSGSEVRFVSAIPVAKLQLQADGCARAYREVDTRIQCLNWTSDLLE